MSGKYFLSVCVSGGARAEVVDALAKNPLYAMPPPKMKIKREVVRPPASWSKTLGASDVEARALWPEDPEDDHALKSIIVNPDFDSVYAHAPDAFDDPEQVCAFLEALPFTLCTIGDVGLHSVAADNPKSFFGHPAMGWGCAFRGKGHDVLVSRRWLEYGPWQLIRRPNDLSIVLFHDLDADFETAKKQAGPGHVRMASWSDGGYMRGQQAALNGLYKAKEHMFQVIVNPGQELNQKDLTNACAARAARQTGEERIERLAYMFMDEQDARPNLHELWLREIEVWYVDGTGKHRLDDEYKPMPTPPAWSGNRATP
jgi:hypothetical protein